MSWSIFLRRLLVGWVLLYTLICLTLGGSRSAPTAWLVVAVLWPLVVWRCLGRPDAAAGRFFSFLEILATNIALGLVLGELTLRLAAPWSGAGLLVSTALDGHRLAPGHDYGYGLRGNALGYPGPDWSLQKKPDVKRIAALGDSFAVGPAVPFADCYLTRLEKECPGVEVLNFGVSGAGPREYLAILEKDVWRFQPDLVLVSVFIGNDITETLPVPRYLAPEQHALYLFGQRLWRLTRERGRCESSLAVPADRLAGPSLSVETYWEVETRRLQVCRKPVTAALEKKWQRAVGTLGRLVQSCRQRGTPMALVLIPDEFQVNPAVLDEACRRAGLAPADLDLDLPQRRLRDFARQQSIPCLDLLPELRGLTSLYAPQDTHWNVAGNHRAAQAIAAWGRQQGW